jgi:hypothetical protein
MNKAGSITMTMRALDRLKLIEAVVNGNLKPMQAAQRLELTTRQVQRLVNRYRSEGAGGLISRKRDRPGNRQLDQDLPSVFSPSSGIVMPTLGRPSHARSWMNVTA